MSLFETWLRNQDIGYEEVSPPQIPNLESSLYFISSKKIFIHFINLHTKVNAIVLQELSIHYQQEGFKIIQLWEDVWIKKQSIVKSRLSALFGGSNKIHGRKTKIIKLNQTDFDTFMEGNHLQGSTKAKLKFGLIFENDLVAAASFSPPRKISRNNVIYKSGELIRYANLLNHTVVGGLSKLLKHYESLYTPDDIMTYTDIDWSDGKSYESLGFSKIRITPPQNFLIDFHTHERYYAKRLNDTANHYLSIWNTGNIKFLKFIQKLN